MPFAGKKEQDMFGLKSGTAVIKVANSEREAYNTLYAFLRDYPDLPIAHTCILPGKIEQRVRSITFVQGDYRRIEEDGIALEIRLCKVGSQEGWKATDVTYHSRVGGRPYCIKFRTWVGLVSGMERYIFIPSEIARSDHQQYLRTRREVSVQAAREYLRSLPLHRERSTFFS